MKYLVPFVRRRNVRMFVSCAISYLMLCGHLAPLALAAASPAAKTAKRTESVSTSTTRAASPAPVAAAAAVAAASITATKSDSFPDPEMDGKATPGQTITYTVTVANNGNMDATNVQFNDTVDANTTLVANSVMTTPLAVNDSYNVFGNVRIQPNAANGLLANDRDPDTGNNTGLTASGPTTSTQGGNVTVNSDGSFSYNPPAGFEGTDTFTYTVTDASNKTGTGTVTLNVNEVIWFVNNAAATNGDGRLTSPFNSLAPIAANNNTDPDEQDDFIYIHQGNSTYAGGFAFEPLQIVGGQELTPEQVIASRGLTFPPHSDPRPTAAGRPTVTNAAGNVITLNSGANLQSVNLTASANNAIFGSGVTAPTVQVASVGITLSGSANGISLTNFTANASFMGVPITANSTGVAVIINGGNAIVDFQFGAISQSGSGRIIDVQNRTGNTVSFSSTVPITGTNITGISSAAIFLQNNSGSSAFTFDGAVNISTSNARGIVATSTGSVTMNNASNVINATGGAAIDANGTPLSMTFTSLTSTNSSAHGLRVAGGGTGGITSGTTTITNPASEGISISGAGSLTSFNFGNTTVNSSGLAGVSLINNAGPITFADLDIAPDAGQRGFVASTNSQTITATSGDITTSNARAVEIAGLNSGTRTPLNVTFTSITASGASASVQLINVSGTQFRVTGTTQINSRTGTGIDIETASTSTVQFGTTNIPNPNAAAGYGIRIQNSSSAFTFASATISDAKQVTQQTDTNADFIPDTDGDGDAIFLKNNTSGSFALNGGTLSNCGNDCIDARTVNNFSLSNVTITNPGVDTLGTQGSGLGGHGIQAIDLTGTTNIAGSTIQGFNVDSRDGFRLINSTSTALTVNVTGTTFQNSTGSNGILISGRNASNVNFNVGGATNNASTNCTFQNLSGAAITHNAGDTAGSTSVVNLTVRHSTFQNAQPNGLNTLSARNLAGGRANIVIENNTFNNVARTASSNTGVITVNGDGIDANNQLSLTIQNNTISNIGALSAATCGSVGNCTAYRGIQVFIDDNTKTSGEILIANNTLTNIQRDGILFDVNNSPTGSDVSARITNNTVGTDAARVGIGGGGQPQHGIRIIRRCKDGAIGMTCGRTASIVVSNNSVRNGEPSQNGSTLNTPGIFARAEDDSSLLITMTGNSVDTATANSVAEIRADTNFAIGAGPFMCLNLPGNTIPAGAGGLIAINETQGVLDVKQASTAAISASHNGATVTVGGTPQFSSACTAPTAPLETSADTTPAPGGIATESANSARTATPTRTERPAPTRNNVTSRPFISPRPNATRSAQAGRTAQPSATERTAQNTQAAGSDEAPAPVPVINAAAGTVMVNIGTLPAGKSVTITFQVTINEPFPSGTSQVSNQGTVTADGGINVVTDDPDTAAPNDPTVTLIQPPPDLRVNDASVVEPQSATAEMTFTVTLSPASSNTVTVNYATANDTTGANPATGGTDCANAGTDYISENGMLSFAAGETIKTVSVTVCSDADSNEVAETFLVNLSMPTNANIADSQAVGTIQPNATASMALISELRTSGPAGPEDDFVEIYNNTDSNITVNASDSSAGWGLYKSGADCNASPVLVGTIPNGTVIPARGHYLFVGSAYNLSNYGGTGAAAGNASLSPAIENDRSVGLFTTSEIANISSVNRLDAVGFSGNTGSLCDMLREGGTLPAAQGSMEQYSFGRDQGNGRPKDTDNNAADFILWSVFGSAIGASPSSVLGAPGPENLASPIDRTAQFGVSLIDPQATSAQPPNRVRDFTTVGNGAAGTMTIRKRFTNNTGGNVTRLRFRIVNITTFNSPNVFGGQQQADLRADSSSDQMVTITGGSQVTVRGLTLEQPPTQPSGGGMNSSLSAGTITLGTPLANGASIDVQFRLGVMQTGRFRFFVNLEVLP